MRQVFVPTIEFGGFILFWGMLMSLGILAVVFVSLATFCVPFCVSDVPAWFLSLCGSPVHNLALLAVCKT